MSKKIFLSTFLGVLFLIVGFWFSNISILNAAVLAIPDVCSNNLLQNRNEITCLRVYEAPTLRECSVHAECCMLCEADTAVCVISNPARYPFARYSDNERDTWGGYVSSCTDSIVSSDNWAYCFRTPAGSCPTGYSDSFYDGYDCEIYKEKDVDNIYKADGKWNASQEECITCDGKIEDKVCATTGSFFLNGSGDCSRAGDGTFQLACDTSISVSCDDEIVGATCDTGKTCDANGLCVASAGLSLTASANPVSVGINGASTITFLVKKDTTPVAGAVVEGITASGGSVDLTNCTTQSLHTPLGSCAVTYTAPNTPGIYTISATKATKAGEVDSGTANTIVTVNDCPTSSIVAFADSSYVLGDNMDLLGRDNVSSFTLCLYDTSNNLESSKEHDGPSAPIHLYKTADVAGEWKGKIVTGTFPVSCPGTFSATGCFKTVTVGGAACTPVITCSTASCAETSPTTAEAIKTCINSCTGTSTTSTISCCLNDNHCSVTDPVCNVAANQCVECLINNDCTGTDVCNTSYTCQPCGGEGELRNDISLCCSGLNLVAGECTSKCDPEGYYFCPTTGTDVRTLVQAGEKMIGYILGVIGSLALLLIIIAGVMYMTSAGSEEKIASSKKILTGSIIGLGIALLAFSLLQAVLAVLNM